MSRLRVTVVVPRALQHLAGGQHHVEVELVSGNEATLASVMDALSERYPGVCDRALDERGEVRRHVNVFVDSESIRTGDGLATRVHDGAEVVILPAVSGGR